jgi:hypothetical protein
MAVHPDAGHRDGLVLERCRDEPAQEQRLAEIPVMDDPDYRRTEFQNLQEIADLRVELLSVYIRSAGQGDELLVHRPVLASSQTQRAAR